MCVCVHAIAWKDINKNSMYIRVRGSSSRAIFSWARWVLGLTHLRDCSCGGSFWYFGFPIWGALIWGAPIWGVPMSPHMGAPPMSVPPYGDSLISTCV